MKQISEKDPAILDRDDLQILFGAGPGFQDKRLAILHNFGVYLSRDAKYSDFDVMRKLVRLDAAMVNDDHLFVDDLSMVFNGWHMQDSLTCPFTHNCGNPYSLVTVLRHGGSGFALRFRDPDPTNNQVYHFWEYVDTGFMTNTVVSNLGVTGHEIQGIITGGASWQDLDLGLQGTRLGSDLRLGNLSRFDVWSWLYRNIGDVPPTLFIAQE